MRQDKDVESGTSGKDIHNILSVCIDRTVDDVGPNVELLSDRGLEDPLDLKKSSKDDSFLTG